MIYLVRHAQTDFNKRGVIQARENSDLNEKGLRQVKKLRDEISSLNFDICYCSPLLRTVETAFGLVGDRTFIEKDDRLLERFMGDLEGKDRKFYDFKKYWDYNLNCVDAGVEGIQELFKRCSEFLADVRGKYVGRDILIVSHAAVIRALHHLLLGTDLQNTNLYYEIDNCSLEKFEI